MIGRAIPDDNRIAHKNMERNTALIFQIIRKCCVLISKLVNITLKKYLKKMLILWEYILKVNYLCFFVVSNQSYANHKKLWYLACAKSLVISYITNMMYFSSCYNSNTDVIPLLKEI